MNILMLGNGFDLYHKLPTAYINFMHVVSHFHKKYKNTIPAFLDSFLNDKELLALDSNIKVAYDTYKNVYAEITISQDEHEQIISLKDNYWYKYFSKCCDRDLTWIDFEKEIAYVLNSFSNFFEKTEFSDSLGTLLFRRNHSAVNHFGFFFEKIENTNGFYGFLNDYIYEKPVSSNIKNIDKEKIYKKLYSELLDLAEKLKLYLYLFVDKPLIKMHEQGLVKTNEGFNNYDSIITFNYTNTYQTLYNNNPIYYIHGNLNSNIVLGINPDNNDELFELSDIDTSYIMFKKYYQRVLYRTDNSFIEMISNIKEQRQGITHEYNRLVVCGHSLDVTDQDIIKEVFDISDNISVICHRLDSIGNYVSNLIKIYGKKEFDRIRSEKQLKFITYEEWREEQLTQAFLDGFC